MSPPAPPVPSRRPWLYCVPLLLCLLSFGPGLTGAFVMDDFYAIVHNQVVTGPLPASAAFTHTFWGQPLSTPPTAYRPLAVLLFRLDHALLGLHPLPFHISALLTYLITVALGIRVSLIWLAPAEALVSACLFATLPLHVENVASLVGRADTLGLLFSLVALLCLAPALRGPAPQPISPLRLAGAAAAQVLALLSKESAATLPLIAAALLGIAPLLPARDLLRRQLPAIVLGLTLLAYMLVRLALIPATFHNPIVDDVAALGTAWQRVLYALSLVSRYSRLLVVPLDLCTGRKYAEVSLPPGPDLHALLGTAILLGAALGTARDLRARRPPLWLCALLAYSIFSSLLFSVPEAMADRFMLAPTYFLCLPAGAWLARWGAGQRAKAALVCCLVLLQAGASALYCRAWHSTLTLMQHSVVACPSSVHDHLRLAEELDRVGSTQEALWHFAVAAEGRRHFPQPWRHPAEEAEAALPVGERLRRLHELLCPAEPAAQDGPWRRALARMLAGQGHQAEAALALETGDGPPQQGPPGRGR